jgi:single-strand DNA-binding protein
MAIGSFNKAIIGGRLGRDPEIHTFEGGDRVARLSIATTEQWTSGGARQEKTDWHIAALFKKSAVTFAERNLKKGDLVIVEGRLENRSYQKDGQTYYVAEIVVREGRGDIQLMAKAGSERPEGAPRRVGQGWNRAARIEGEHRRARQCIKPAGAGRDWLCRRAGGHSSSSHGGDEGSGAASAPRRRLAGASAPLPRVLPSRGGDGLPLHVSNRIGATAGQRLNVIFTVAGARAAREPGGRAGMLALKFPRHGAGPALRRRKRARPGERESQRDQKAASCHRLLMPDDPDEQGGKNSGAENYAECGLREVAARRHPRELRHDKTQIAVDHGEVGAGLIGLPQRERERI